MATNPIDKLEIEVSANAQKASQTLSDLIKQIDGLSNSLRNFDASKMINQLGQIGKSLQGTNLGNLTKQINALNAALAKYGTNMQKVSKAGTSSNTALYHLSKSTAELSRGLDNINGRLNNFISKFRRAEKVTKNFAQTAGLLYARFFLLIRGVKGLGKMVKSSMDYIEVMNYFDTSFGQIAKDSVGGWKEAGYDSAQAYYDSFKERATSVTKDMSGYFTNSKGLLESTGLKNLGMNPSEVIQYQTQFAQISNSMGATGEQALKLSEVLTKLGGDLASVRNMEFADVWKDMTSGLVGQARVWDKYGANIRAANMEAKLHELGINANVNALSQADKALLRTIILLDASKGGWTDLIRTLDTPANQLRLISNNIRILGQMIGQILLPVVAKVLPYINAFIIALQRLFGWLAKILHIDIKDLSPNGDGKLADNSGIGDLLDDAEGLGDAFDKDTDSAKKLKKQLQGFDALNNLSSNEDNGKGNDLGGLASGLLNDAFLNAVDEYLNAWNDAFAHLEDNAKNIADRIQAFFEHLAAPLKKAWDKAGKYFVDSWKRAIFAVQALFKVMGQDFWKVWDEDKTAEIFEHVLYILGDIGMVVRNLVKRFREAWMTNNNGYHILANIRDIVLTIVDHFHQMSSAAVEWSKDINFTPLLSKFATFLEAVNEVIGHVMDVMVDLFNTVLLPLAKWTIEKGLPDLLQVFIDFKDKVDWEGLKEKLHTFFTYVEPFAEKIGEGLIIFIDRVSTALADFVNSDKFENFLKKIEEWMDKVTPEDIANFFGNLVEWFIKFKIAVAGFKVAKGLGEVVVWISNLKKALGFGGTVAKGTKELSGLSKVVQSFTGGTGLKATFEAMKFAGNTKNLGLIFGAGNVAEIGATMGLWLGSSILAAIGGFGLGKKIGAAITGDKDLYENFKWFGEGGFWDDVQYMFTDMIPNGLKQAGTSIKETFGNLGETTSTNVGTAVDGAKEKFAEFQESASEKFTSVKETVSASMDTTKKKIGDGFSKAKENAINAWDSVGNWFESNVSTPIANAFQDLKDSRLATIFEGIGILFKAGFITIKDWLDTNVIEPVIESWNNFKDTIQTQVIEPIIQSWENFKISVSEIWSSITTFFEESWSSITTWVDTNVVQPLIVSWENLKTNVTNAIGAVWIGLQTIWSQFSGWVDANVIQPVVNGWNQFKLDVSNIFTNLWQDIQNTWSTVTTWFDTTIVQPLVTNFDKAITGIKDAFSSMWEFLKTGFKTAFNGVIGIVEKCINGIIGGINKTFTGFNSLVSKAALLTGDSWSGVKLLSRITLARYANGGFPESGQLFLAREAGAEMVGSMNGKTAVANNDQIVQGISAGVYNANQEQNDLLRQQNSLLQAILEKDTGISANEIFKSVQNSATSYYRMTGNRAFT